jgi:hypothetical protein
MKRLRGFFDGVGLADGIGVQLFLKLLVIDIDEHISSNKKPAMQNRAGWVDRTVNKLTKQHRTKNKTSYLLDMTSAKNDLDRIERCRLPKIKCPTSC